LLDLVRKVYPNAPAVFTNTGLEYPELQRFVYDTDNVIMLRPKMEFQQVITEYGYPLISKEISEAIYYARRKPQRERERERASYDAPINVPGNIPFRGMDEVRSVRKMLFRITATKDQLTKQHTKNVWNCLGKETIRRRKDLLGIRGKEQQNGEYP